ncbi:MAG: 5-formyltetrahydrofolate cyclo-ligase, partial [Alsobacter sp.]
MDAASGPSLEIKPGLADKAALRAAALARRDALEPAARTRFSHDMAENAASLDWPPGAISGFWPIRSEIDPRPLMRLLAGRGMQLALPRVEHHGLSFRRFTFE